MVTPKNNKTNPGNNPVMFINSSISGEEEAVNGDYCPPSLPVSPQELLAEIAARLLVLKQQRVDTRANANYLLDGLLDNSQSEYNVHLETDIALIDCVGALVGLFAPLLNAEPTGLRYSQSTTSAAGLANSSGAAHQSQLLMNEELPKRLTKAYVQAVISQPIEPSLFGAKTRYRKPIAVLDDKLALRVIELLGRYGPMTTYQLASWFLAANELVLSEAKTSKDGSLTQVAFEDRFSATGKTHKTLINGLAGLSQSLRVQVQYALQHAQCVRLVSCQTVASWHNRDARQKKIGHLTNLWSLERLGLAVYETQTRSKSNLVKVGAAYAHQKEHTLGIQQTLAVLNMVCAVASSSSNVKDDETSLAITPQLEVMAWATSIRVRVGSKRNVLRPDATGRLSLNGVSLESSGAMGQLSQLTTAAHIPGVVVPTKNSSSGLMDTAAQEQRQAETFVVVNSSRVEWPFALEYDRATELPEVFADKYQSYAALYSQSFLSNADSPTLWQEKPPVVLTVTEGSNKHLLDMMLAVAHLAATNKSRHRMVSWWFTRQDWLKHAYKSYMSDVILSNWELSSSSSNDSANNGRRSDLRGDLERVRIWLPLRILVPDPSDSSGNGNGGGSNSKPAFNLGQLNRLSQYFVALNSKAVLSGKVRPPATQKVFSQMCSIPLPHLLSGVEVIKATKLASNDKGSSSNGDRLAVD